MRVSTVAAALLGLLCVAPAAHEYTSKGVTVAHPWARATSGGAKVGAAYFEVRVDAGKGDRLIEASTPVAALAEVHEHSMEAGVARMRRVEVIAVPAGKPLVLGPGGYDVMLMGLKEPLKEGDIFKLTVVFERAGAIEVDATVEPIGAMGPHGFEQQPATKPDGGGHRHH